MRKETQTAAGLVEVSAERATWERPVMSRMDAADAEQMAGGGSDNMTMQSMNS